MTSKGKEIQESNTSQPDESGISEIRTGDTNEKNSHFKGNINKKRMLSPVTTTPYPSNMVKPIAFYAYMSKNTPIITIQHPLSFDVVKTNLGNGYHSTTGVFMVPESGVYVFTWTIRVRYSSYHSTQLMVNTDELGVVYLSVASGSDVGVTGIVVAHVNKGDDIYVRTHASWNNGNIISDNAGRSSFAGWKLF
ncbi:complement C1q-like protein 2 [Saccostrea echinata]|uniref:complement C1q-like protein 2 n=1 Tax=Saccostrea echinata TaxID=191078 RepID=UPI002A81149C|nr:complement C1q-like protein 2 [Saccostrea echinata]